MPFGFEQTPASLFIVLRISRRQGRCYAALILTGFRHFRNRLTLLGRPLGSRGLAPEPSATAGRAGSTGQLNDIFPLPISTFIRSNALIPSSGSGIGLPTSIASTLFRTQEPISSRLSQKSVIGYLVPSAVDAVDPTDDEFKSTPSLPAAARGNAREAEPHVYWANWVCSFLGTRTSEVADANSLDIERIDGIWVMSIHRKHRSRDQRLKTKVSTRKLALHGALLDEGFLDYWRSLPVGGPLFPNVPLDTYGKRVS